MTTRRPPVGFYDSWTRRLVGDYVRGNPRAESAITFAVEFLPEGELDVLDVGCGIGWSTAEISRHRPDARVVGLDLSPTLIELAQRLFGDQPRITFAHADFVDSSAPLGASDVIVLLDVYEHFARSARAQVHARLGASLRTDGRLILTTPTIAHQDFLRANHPDRLQPIDEDVSEADLERLAADVGGRVIERRVVSIFRQSDYMHTVIERGAHRGCATAKPLLESGQARAERLRRRLGMRWTRAAGLVSARGRDEVCIAKTWAISETFIRAHIENLPASVHVLGAAAYRDEEGDSLLPGSASRIVELFAHARKRSASISEDRVFERLPHAVRSYMYRRYLRREGVELVLAEYGVTAAEIAHACFAAGIPLIPHFHGYDAFQSDVIQRHGGHYRQIFARGWPVIAVSESMKLQLIELGAKPDQVHVIRYGIDLDKFRPSEPTPGLVVMVGRLVQKKAPQLALEAFARAASRVPEARLVVVGDGPLRSTIERRIRDLRLADRVRLDGARNHDWVVEMIRQAAVFVQHSVVAHNGDREGTPVAILEASAAGVPVVATRHEGIAEVVVDGATGILVDEGDIEAMGDAVADLLLDPAKARTLGLAGRTQVEKIAGLDASIERLWTVLESALANEAARRA